MIEIKHRITGEVLRVLESDTLSNADLRTIIEQAEENQALKARIAELEQQSEARLQEAKIKDCELDTQIGIVRSLCGLLDLRVYDYQCESKAKKALERLKLEQQAKGLEEMLDVTDTWSVMNTYAITVDDIYEQMQELRQQAKQLKGGE